MNKQAKQISVSKDKPIYEWLLVLAPLLVVCLAYSSKTVDVVLMPKFVASAIFTIIITCAAYMTAMHNPESFNAVKSHLFFKIYLIYLAIYFIGLQWTCNYADGIFEWLKLYIFGASTFSLAVHFYQKPHIITMFARSVTILNIVLVTIGLVQLLTFFTGKNVSHSSTYIITATFGHKNIFAEMLFMVFPFSIYQLFAGSKIWKWLGVVCALLNLFLITLMLTRAVWLAVLLGFLFSFPFYLYAIKLHGQSLTKQPNNKKTWQLVALLIITVVAGIFLYSRFDTFGTFRKQMVSISYYRYGSGGERIELWKKSLKVFKENPLLGTGIGSWKIEVLKYGHKGLETENNKTFHQRPHNDFIWILAEQGIVGLAAYLLLVAIVLYNIIRKLKNTTDPQLRLFYFSCQYTYIGYLIFSFFSFPKERMEHNVILMFVFAIVLMSDNLNKGSNGKANIVHLVFVLALLLNLFALNVGIKRFTSEVHMQKAYTARAESNWQKVVDEIAKAENENYTIDPMCTPLKWYSGSAYYNMGNQEKAFDDFYSSYLVNPNHVHVLNNLGTAYEIKGEHDKAINMYQRALVISPGFRDSELNLSATFYNAAKKDDAFIVFNKIPFDSTDNKYMQMLPLLIRHPMLVLADSISCIPLKMMVQAIDNTPSWSARLFMKSKANNISFNKQILADAIFVIDTIEKKNNFVYIKSIKKKYTIH